LPCKRQSQDIASVNNPVNFYGLCIDQNNKPIPGVKIAMDVRHLEYLPAVGQYAKYPSKEFTTGPDGRFEWSDSDDTGDVLSLDDVEKTGYVLSTKAPKHFGAQSGNFSNPVILKMWKKGKSQNLISHGLSRVGVPVDGSEVQFDLFNGVRVQSGGQIIMRIKRDPQVLPPGHPRYNWSADLEIPNGGLIASDDDFMYSAPESGYQETYEIEMSKDSEGWKSSLDQNFYIELDNGKYFGSLTVHLLTFHSPPPVILNLEIVINPDGSQNLEPSN
jgi:hypothetical protein